MKRQGRIFNIQRYSIHDGKGIRTIVFFKGCFLRCRWCCNPESQNYEIETMMSVSEADCYLDKEVSYSDKVGNQSNQMGSHTHIEESRSCKEEIVGRDVTVAEIIKEVERDRVYYRRSGGGLTLSGGEVLMQPDFARDLLCAAKERGIHTTIESTALAEYREIEKLLPYLDEFLMDIKHMNPAKHEEFTGKQNDKALENAEKIAASKQVQLIIRVPVVPGFNATTEEIADIARFAGKLPGVEEIHLLPYHRLGEGKYMSLGREYKMQNVAPPDDSLMEELKSAVLKVADLRCQIGG